MPLTQIFRVVMRGTVRAIALSEESAWHSVEQDQASDATARDLWSVESIMRDIPLVEGAVSDCGNAHESNMHVTWRCPVCAEEHDTDLDPTDPNPALWYCEHGCADDMVLVYRLSKHEPDTVTACHTVVPEQVQGPGDLWSGDEESRRAAIMWASRRNDRSCLPRLLELLETDSYANRRQIVRTLGNFGGPEAETHFFRLLDAETNLILGDVLHALTNLGANIPIDLLKRLESHDHEWVRQNARSALKRAGQ